MVRPAFPLVLHIPLVFCAGEPKKCFLCGISLPIHSIIQKFYNKVTTYQRFIMKKKVFFDNLP